ncbi:hypothetical protein IP90_00590 [Luteimonas cucumeris]|uniref:TonB-dependent transporter Oar-like beta-barrel domain-containing protein n=1 Tax=Luteimonas cucumeris TaxID=985012 RepID=A0A562LFD3_9GAMM|nr:TonB-dependent receptor [Luteimonas cucumeris]TWI06324.1 hypothetical protein IP90_00590 [Luteimonas cucumeris]
MASKYLAKGLKRSALTIALGLSFVGGVQAQTNTAGAVTGRAVAGDTITIENPATGFSRTITVGNDGNYRVSQVPIGQYTITRTGADGTTGTRTASVSVGSTANVSFVTASGDAQTLDTVTVVGTGAINPIDVSSVESTTILTAEQIAKIPVARDATSVALLAPGTVRGDATFGNLASFGGSSVAENQYFVNGFNITNTFNNLNFAQIPFEAIAEQQIKTGGYGAEFGRSTGGVINMITKRGTNEFKAGGSIFWAPEELRENQRNTYLENVVDLGHAGQLREDNSQDTQWEATAAVWAGGALIKDRLFAYGLLQYGREEFETFGNVTSTRNNSQRDNNPNWLLKMDWSISDNHQLELTAFSDKTESEIGLFNTTPAGSTNRGSQVGTFESETGGESYVVRYTGYLTDSFTLSALFGHGEFSRSDKARTSGGIPIEYNGDIFQGATGCPRVIDARPGSRQAITGVYSSQCNIGAGTLTRKDAGDTRDQFRIDAEWQLGDHLLRFGYDADDFESIDGSSPEGGSVYQYQSSGDTDIVLKQSVRQGATVKVESRAFYVEDSWSITDNFIAYLGLRWDSFDNKNGAGQTYASIDNQFGPRLGFSWDVNGDSSFKVFGNAGRYALPLTATVAVRGASASLFVNEFFFFDGVDPVSGVPLNTELLQFQYANNEFGVAKDPNTIVSQNLDPMYQDEYILGFQKQLSDNFSVGVRGIYRDLKAAIDDQCDYRSVVDWAVDNGFTLNEDTDGFQEHNPDAPNEISMYNPGFPFCRLYNPGSDGIFNMDVNGDGTLERVEIPADVLGPAAKRKYSALEFFFDGNWDKFFLQGSYTFARSRGNSEGGVKSDIGQSDTGTTQDFDYPELTRGTYGYLPNDRRHSLKLFGNYQFNDQWSVGANLLVQSGRPLNCIGNDFYVPGDDRYTPPDPDLTDLENDLANQLPYRAAYFRCRTIDDTKRGRGSYGRLPWTTDVDINVAWRPAFAEGLQFKMDVFNILNSRKVVERNETGEGSASLAPLETFLLPTAFQSPRYVRFMVQYDF